MSSPEIAAVKAHDALDRIDDALDRILAATDHLDPAKRPKSKHHSTTPKEADDDDQPA